MKEKNESFDYDPDKLHQINVRARDYHTIRPATISVNSLSGTFSITKNAIDLLMAPGTKKLKVIFLSDGHKMFIDSMVQPEDDNFLNISESNTGCSRAVTSEIQKLYKILNGDRGVFTLEMVEKQRFLLILEKTEPIMGREYKKKNNQVEV